MEEAPRGGAGELPVPVLARNPKHPTAGWGDGGGAPGSCPRHKKS